MLQRSNCLHLIRFNANIFKRATETLSGDKITIGFLIIPQKIGKNEKENKEQTIECGEKDYTLFKKKDRTFKILLL